MRRYNIWLLRHGKTKGPSALNGHFDAKVENHIQEKIKKKINGLNLSYRQIISSPLSRCLDLATLLSHNKELMINAHWKEMNFGDFDGVPFESLSKCHWLKLESFWNDPLQSPLPKAETLEQFYQRVSQSWDNFIRHLDRDTLIVTHGGVIRMILAQSLNLVWTNSALYTQLMISHQSITHIEVILSDTPFVMVRSIGVTL